MPLGTGIRDTGYGDPVMMPYMSFTCCCYSNYALFLQKNFPCPLPRQSSPYADGRVATASQHEQALG